MELHRCKVKFHNRKIICASEILCTDCPQRHECEEVNLYTESKFEGVIDVMSHDGHKRKNKRLKQTRFEKR